MFFIDDTFCLLEINEDYDHIQSIFVSTTVFSTNPDDYNAGTIYDLEKIGIIDTDELNQLLEVKTPIDIENFKQKELKQLAELKKKYENNI